MMLVAFCFLIHAVAGLRLSMLPQGNNVEPAQIELNDDAERSPSYSIAVENAQFSDENISSSSSGQIDRDDQVREAQPLDELDIENGVQYAENRVNAEGIEAQHAFQPHAKCVCIESCPSCVCTVMTLSMIITIAYMIYKSIQEKLSADFQSETDGNLTMAPTCVPHGIRLARALGNC